MHSAMHLHECVPCGQCSSAYQQGGMFMQETYQRIPDNFVVKHGKRLRRVLNRWLHGQSSIGHGPFFGPAEIPGLDALTANWEAIRDEAEVLLVERESIPPLGRISPDHRRIATTSAWKSFFLCGYGYRFEANRARCPATAATLDRIPGVVVAFFSIFEPGTHVPAHFGLTKALLNVHLGLVVPEGPERCELRVRDEFRKWSPGQLLVFDETYDHEAWNLSDKPRVVLFLHVRRPMRWLGRLAGSLFIAAVRRTRVVQDARRALEAG